MNVNLFVFTNDLRLDDNPAFIEACKQSDHLVCVYVDEPWQHQANQQGLTSLGEHRKKFLSDSLSDLQAQLKDNGQTLFYSDLGLINAVDAISEQLPIGKVFRSSTVGVYENRLWQRCIESFNEIDFFNFDTHTLFDSINLPFEISDLPETFSKFRKLVEADSSPEAAVAKPETLPKPPAKLKVPGLSAYRTSINTESAAPGIEQSAFRGGSHSGWLQIEDYFSGRLPAHYKEVRNAIDGWDNSTKFSPWLANGSVSVRRLYERLTRYENEVEKNGSTYWIYFELLWREYFQWYAKLHGAKLFSFDGIKRRKPLTSFYPERFKRWTDGNTPYPLVNACMNQLKQTGFLSNRGRQIVASCLVNELAVDWRYGAAYFEHQLIDYDVASNWGNWQYLAGVGADPRQKRHFNLEKQTEMFDADGEYRLAWGATEATHALDSVDAADWPIA